MGFNLRKHNNLSKKIEKYLRSKPGFSPELEVIDLRTHASGWSRETISFVIGPQTPTSQAERLVIRFEKDSGVLDTDLEREYKVMAAVDDYGVPIPSTYFYEVDHALFNREFFLTEFIDGDVLDVWDKSDRTRLEIAWEEKTIAKDFVEILGSIHSVPLSDSAVFRDITGEQFSEELRESWIGLYEEVKPKSEPIIDEAIRWFRKHPPVVDEVTLIHNDYRIGNIIVKDDKINAVLDWELAQVGDPMFDLGYASMNMFSGQYYEPTSGLASGLLERNWFYDYYEEVTGREVDTYAVTYWRAFSIFRSITIWFKEMTLLVEGKIQSIDQFSHQNAIPALQHNLLDALESMRNDLGP
jgi:aminoglycoside phosphotransferase (APT) family kinase protein